MSLLANNTFANPGNSFYAVAGGGGGDSLQSPVDITPAVDTTVSLTLGPIVAGGSATITVGSFQENNTSLLSLNNGNYGSSAIEMGNGGSQVLLEVAALSSTFEIANAASGTNIAALDTLNNAVTLGNGPFAPAGNTVVNTPLIIQDQDFSGTALSISGQIPFIGVNGVTSIKNTVASGGAIQIGSSLATPTVMSVFDTLGGAAVSVGGNGVGLTDVVISGGIVGGAANITTSASNTGQMTIGASATNSQTVFVRDGATANSGYVDITGGTAGTDALRLRGYQTGGSPTISTNRITGAAAAITITPGSDDVTPAMTIVNDGAGNVNTNFFQTTNFSKPILASSPWSPQVLRVAGVASGTFDVDLTQLPSGWAIVYGSSTTPLVDRQAMFSVMVYTGATSQITGGGIGGIIGLADTIVSATNPAALQVRLGAPTSANYTILGMTLLGG